MANICDAMVDAALLRQVDAGYALGQRLVEYGEAYHLAGIDLEVVCHARRDGRHPVRLASEVGRHLPASCTGGGTGCAGHQRRGRSVGQSVGGCGEASGGRGAPAGSAVFPGSAAAPEVISASTSEAGMPAASSAARVPDPSSGPAAS